MTVFKVTLCELEGAEAPLILDLQYFWSTTAQQTTSKERSSWQSPVPFHPLKEPSFPAVELAGRFTKRACTKPAAAKPVPAAAPRVSRGRGRRLRQAAGSAHVAATSACVSREEATRRRSYNMSPSLSLYQPQQWSTFQRTFFLLSSKS